MGAIQASALDIKELSVWVVGMKTRAVLEKHALGCSIRGEQAGGAKALAHLIIAAERTAVVWITGHRSRPELQQVLQQHRVHLEKFVVYRTIAKEDMDVPAEFFVDGDALPTCET